DVIFGRALLDVDGLHLMPGMVEVAVAPHRDGGADGDKTFLQPGTRGARRRRQGQVPDVVADLDLHGGVGTRQGNALDDGAGERGDLFFLAAPAVMGESGRGNQQRHRNGAQQSFHGTSYSSMSSFAFRPFGARGFASLAGMNSKASLSFSRSNSTRTVPPS